MALLDNYSDNGLPTETVMTPTVSAESLKPMAPIATPAPTQERQFAIPTVSERKAWRQAATRDVSPVSGMINQVADDVAKTNPQGAEIMRRLGEMHAQALREQEEERAYRVSEIKAARETIDRMQEASQRRSAREYNDTNPSWADVFRNNPLVQNTIGNRRYNPYTGEIEHHYPRNTAEGIGNFLGHLPELAHAFFTGDNALQRHNRAVDEFNMIGPYEKQMANAEEYRTGRMVQPGNTVMDKLAEMYEKAKVGRENEAADLENIYRLSNRVGEIAGPTVGSAYFRTKLGLPTETVANYNVDDIINDPTVGLDTLQATAADLQSKVVNASTETERLKAVAALNKVQRTIEGRIVAAGGTLPKLPIPLERKKEIGAATRKELEGLYSGRLRETIPTENVEQLMQSNGDVKQAIDSIHDYLLQQKALGKSDEDLRALAKEYVKRSEVINAARQKRNGWETAGTTLAEYGPEVILSLVGAGVGAKALKPISAALKIGKLPASIASRVKPGALTKAALAAGRGGEKAVGAIAKVAGARPALASNIANKTMRGIGRAAQVGGIVGGGVAGWQLGDQATRLYPFWTPTRAEKAAQRGYTDYLMNMMNATDPTANMEALRQMAIEAQNQKIEQMQHDPMSSVDTTGTGT